VIRKLHSPNELEWDKLEGILFSSIINPLALFASMIISLTLFENNKDKLCG
jgi:hypothetical protein